MLAPVLFYGVVSAQTEKVVEFFLQREAGEAMIGEDSGPYRCERGRLVAPLLSARTPLAVQTVPRKIGNGGILSQRNYWGLQARRARSRE